jgi:hypothetical protein
MQNLKEYLDNHYGFCSSKSRSPRCACIKYEWLGTQCEHWNPFDVSTYEELAEAQKNWIKGGFTTLEPRDGN